MPAGASIPYYNTVKSQNPKKGTSFGYGMKIADYKKSESPGPGRYEDRSIFLRSHSKDSKQGKFGIGYDKFYLVSVSHIIIFKDMRYSKGH